MLKTKTNYDKQTKQLISRTKHNITQPKNTSNMKKSSEKSFKHTNLKAIAKSSKQRMKSTHKQIIMPPSKHQLFKKL